MEVSDFDMFFDWCYILFLTFNALIKNKNTNIIGTGG